MKKIRFNLETDFPGVRCSRSETFCFKNINQVDTYFYADGWPKDDPGGFPAARMALSLESAIILRDQLTDAIGRIEEYNAEH